MEVFDELEIKEEPIDYNEVTSQFLDATEILQESYENEFPPINDYIQIKKEKYIQVQQDSTKSEVSFSNILENLNKSDVVQHIGNNVSENISKSSNHSIRRINNLFDKKAQCIIPLKHIFTQFPKDGEVGQRNEFRGLKTIINPVKSQLLDCHTCGEKFTDINSLQSHLNKHLLDLHNAENGDFDKYLLETKNKHLSGNSNLNPAIPVTDSNKDNLGNTQALKGNRENLIAQAVNSVLSSLNLPTKNVLSTLKTPERGSSVASLNDPLRINYNLDVYNSSHTLNQRPSRISKISAKQRISDSLIEECDSINTSNNTKSNKLKQTNILSKLKTPDRCENVRKKVYNTQKKTKINKPQNRVFKTKGNARNSKNSNMDVSLTSSKLNKTSSYNKLESRKQQKQFFKAEPIGENSKEKELTESRTPDFYRGRSIEPLSDPLGINYDLDVFNSSQNLNQTSSRSCNIYEKTQISDSIIEECDSLKETKNLDISKLNQCGWNWETQFNNYDSSKDSHSPENSDKFNKSDDNDLQSKLRNISEENFALLKIINKDSNCDEKINIENNIEKDFKEIMSIKPKVRRKRMRWIAGEDGMFACNLCSYKATKAPYLKRHLITHVIDKPHKCHICNKSFCHYNSLRMHLDMHNGIRRYQCTLCDYAFIQKVHLKTHMIKHTKEKRYQCEICEKRFSRRDHLRSHLLTHSDERPFPCDECDLAFKNKSNLFHHKRNHANDRRYKCQHCDASFMLSNTLRHHLASHLVYRKGYKVCPECPLFFWSPSQFIRHLTKQHEYTIEQGEQILKIAISETNFRFYRNKKKKIANKELSENIKSEFNNINDINDVRNERNENEDHMDSIKINSLTSVETYKSVEGSKERMNEAGPVVASDILSNMDLNQPIVTCTSRQVLRSSADSQFLVISYSATPDDAIKKTEYFKLVKEDQGGLTIQDLQKKCVSFHGIEVKIMTGNEN